MEYIVHNLPAPLAKGREQLDSNVASRVEFQEHDFFQGNMITAPEVFLLRNVLHSWSDERVAAILQKLFVAMDANTTLLIVNNIVRTPGTLPASEEKRQRFLDMTMFTMMNSQERTEDDRRALIHGVSDGVEITDIATPPGSTLSMMVVIKRYAASQG